MTKRIIQTLGVASSIGGPSDSCALAPEILQASQHADVLTAENTEIVLNWHPDIRVSTANKNSLDIAHKQSCLISQFTQQQIQDNQPFLVLGGDHTSAIGTWAGVMNQLPSDATFALIWIDAHMDAHTLETSPSGNIHGMPVSVLLGEADHKLQSCYPSQSYLDGRDLYMFGVRSYESDELVLLTREKVNVFDTNRIEKDGGTQKVLSQLLNTISRCYDYYAISLDLDAIDPHDAPGVETREKMGVSARNLLDVFKHHHFSERFAGLEIVEFDPGSDIDHKTEKLIYEIIHCVFSSS